MRRLIYLTLLCFCAAIYVVAQEKTSFQYFEAILDEQQYPDMASQLDRQGYNLIKENNGKFAFIKKGTGDLSKKNFKPILDENGFNTYNIDFKHSFKNLCGDIEEVGVDYYWYIGIQPDQERIIQESLNRIDSLQGEFTALTAILQEYTYMKKKLGGKILSDRQDQIASKVVDMMKIHNDEKYEEAYKNLKKNKTTKDYKPYLNTLYCEDLGKILRIAVAMGGKHESKSNESYERRITELTTYIKNEFSQPGILSNANKIVDFIDCNMTEFVNTTIPSIKKTLSDCNKFHINEKYVSAITYYELFDKNLRTRKFNTNLFSDFYKRFNFSIDLTYTWNNMYYPVIITSVSKIINPYYSRDRYFANPFKDDGNMVYLNKLDFKEQISGYEWAEEKGESIDESYPIRIRYQSYKEHPGIRGVDNYLFDEKGELKRVKKLLRGYYERTEAGEIPTSNIQLRSWDELWDAVYKTAYSENLYNIKSENADVQKYIQRIINHTSSETTKKLAQSAANAGMTEAVYGKYSQQARVANQTKLGYAIQVLKEINETGSNWLEQIRKDYTPDFQNLHTINRLSDTSFELIYKNADLKPTWKLIVTFDTWKPYNTWYSIKAERMK